MRKRTVQFDAPICEAKTKFESDFSLFIIEYVYLPKLSNFEYVFPIFKSGNSNKYVPKYGKVDVKSLKSINYCASFDR